MRSINPITLFELTQQIQLAIENAQISGTWVVAEISDLNVNRNGHCYLELIEKNEDNSGLKAKMRATIWANSYRVLKPFFETATNRQLTTGLKVLVQCSPNFHPAYGLSLNINDIDPSFTLGEIEKEKRETINRLIAEGIFDMNRELSLPLLPKRIAVISSATAAGYQDFTNQLDSNLYGYRFKHKLFDAQVQGNEAERSIILAFEKIYTEIEEWDVVALIRGGGSQSDLACFDGYNLTSHIAQFPLPVITGIGHERDYTVADMVAHTRLKTPTAAAEFIISRFQDAELIMAENTRNYCDLALNMIFRYNSTLLKSVGVISPALLRTISNSILKVRIVSQRFIENSLKTIEFQKREMAIILGTLRKSSDHTISHATASISEQTLKIKELATKMVYLEKNTLQQNERVSILVNHEYVLKRGYSITYHKGKVLTDSRQVDINDKIITVLANGSITSIVGETDK